MSERVKALHYHNIAIDQYFWRTTQQQEIDLIEDDGEEFQAYEFKWNANAKGKFPETFTGNYNVSKTSVISQDNLDSFLMIK